MEKTEELIKENEELKKELKSTVEKNNRLYSLNEMEIKVNNQHVEDYKKLEQENDELKERLAIQKKEFEEEREALYAVIEIKKAKLEKIKEEVKKIGACDHCGWEECNKGCASYILLQIIESEE